jgi:hypothetical protein
MATLEELLEQVQDIARRENRPVEDVLSTMIRHYESPDSDPLMRAFRQKLYAKARRYWQSVNDQERLSLTDEELDEQFWLLDQDGVPRLKSEQGEVELPPDPLESIVGILETDINNLSASIRETLAQTTHPRYGWTKRGCTD